MKTPRNQALAMWLTSLSLQSKSRDTTYHIWTAGYIDEGRRSRDGGRHTPVSSSEEWHFSSFQSHRYLRISVQGASYSFMPNVVPIHGSELWIAALLACPFICARLLSSISICWPSGFGTDFHMQLLFAGGSIWLHLSSYCTTSRRPI